MTIDWVALIEGGIPILAGVYATALGFGWMKLSAPPANPVHRWVRHFRWLGPLLILFGLFLGWQAYRQGARPPADSLAASIAAKLSLPVQIDAATRLDAVAGSGDTITYRYTVTVPIEPADVSAFEQLIREQTRQVACIDPGFATILRSGYTVQAHYTLTDPPGEFSIVTGPAACPPAAPGS